MISQAALDWTRYSNGIDELEELALAFLTQAIAAVGSMRHVIDAQRQLIRRFVRILKKSGALTEDARGEWTVAPGALVDPIDFAARLHAEYPVCEVHILWLERAFLFLYCIAASCVALRAPRRVCGVWVFRCPQLRAASKLSSLHAHALALTPPHSRVLLLQARDPSSRMSFAASAIRSTYYSLPEILTLRVR